jgi:UDP-N-acetylmuramoyl-tripeptide--D-alanyl-D-alanine ligase
MRPLAEQVIGKISLDLVDSVDEATEALKRLVRSGDAVLIKASNSVGLAKLVESMAREPACST